MARFFLSAVVVGLAMTFGCLSPIRYDDSLFGQGGTATTTTSTGGAGGSLPCSLTSPCEDDKNPCTKEECANGFCVSTKLTTTMAPGSTECTTIACNDGAMATTVHGGGPCGTGLKCNEVGECTGCMNESECPVPPDCQVVSCVSEICKVENASTGTPPTSVANTPADCKKPICDGKGSITFALDDADLPVDDSNPCTDKACNMAGPVYPPSAKGMACTSVQKPSAKVCDGNSACVECTANGDCTMGMMPSCDMTTLTCISCSDDQQNGTETGLNCGGTCPKCDGDVCGAGGECKSSACEDQVCCSTACSGVCLACNLPGNKGMCSPTPKGLEGSGCTGSGKACTGEGACMSGVTGKAGELCSLNSECYTGACYGMCRLPHFAPCEKNEECASLLCVGNGCQPCSSNAQCASNICSGNGQCLVPGGGVCLLSTDCAGGYCDSGVTHLCGKSNSQQNSCSFDADCLSFHCANGKCAACSKPSQDTDCASKKCDASGNCLFPKDAFCTANGQCGSNVCKGFPPRCM